MIDIHIYIYIYIYIEIDIDIVEMIFWKDGEGKRKKKGREEGGKEEKRKRGKKVNVWVVACGLFEFKRSSGAVYSIVPEKGPIFSSIFFVVVVCCVFLGGGIERVRNENR